MSPDQLAGTDLTDADLYGAGDPLAVWARL
jgi:hypothetical protein